MTQAQSKPTAAVVDIKTKEPLPTETGGGDEGEATDEFWAYLAGLVDADGTIVMSTTPRKTEKRGQVKVGRTARISITMCDLDILETVKVMTGLGGVYLERRKGVNGGNKDVYRWSVQSRADLRTIASEIHPYLGTRKSAKVFELLSLLNHWDLLPVEKEIEKAKKAKKS